MQEAHDGGRSDAAATRALATALTALTVLAGCRADRAPTARDAATVEATEAGVTAAAAVALEVVRLGAPDVAARALAGSLRDVSVARAGDAVWTLEGRDGFTGTIAHVDARGQRAPLPGEARDAALLLGTSTGLVYRGLCDRGLDSCIMHTIAGERPRRVASARGGAGGAPIVADDSAAFFVDRSATSRILVRAPLDGGARAEVLARPLEPAGVFRVGALAIDDEHLYWWLDDVLLRVKKTGGPPLELARDHHATAPVADGTHVYWVEDGALRRVPAAGGAVETVARGALSLPGAIATDATHVYWIGRGNVVRRRSKTSGSEEETTIQDARGHLAIAGGHVYWLGASDHELMRAALP